MVLPDSDSDSASESDWAHTGVFEPDTFGLRKAVGVCRRRVEEERDHWIGWNDWNDWIEDMDSDKSATAVAGAGAGAGADVTAGSDLHDWSGRRMLSVAHSCFLGHGMPWE